MNTEGYSEELSTWFVLKALSGPDSAPPFVPIYPWLLHDISGDRRHPGSPVSLELMNLVQFFGETKVEVSAWNRKAQWVTWIVVAKVGDHTVYIVDEVSEPSETHCWGEGQGNEKIDWAALPKSISSSAEEFIAEVHRIGRILEGHLNRHPTG